jgi:hypothetical protein
MREVMSHLAAAAIMLAEIYLGGSSLAQLRKHVAEERHRYGWEYLSYDEGTAAESAFYRFATFVEKER